MSDVSRDLFNLIGGAPTVLIDKPPSLYAKPKASGRAVAWFNRGFTSSARDDDLVLHHWVKANDEPLDYHFAAFNQIIDVGEYTDAEYELYLRDDDWNKEETAYLWSLCRQLDLRFPVIADRYHFEDGKTRTMEDLKERFYAIQQKLLRGRHAGSLSDPTLQRDLALYDYNKDREIERKSYLEKLYGRTREQIEEEECLFLEVRRLDQNERRLTHEREALLRLLNAHETNLALRSAGGLKSRRPLAGHHPPSGLRLGSGSSLGDSSGLASPGAHHPLSSATGTTHHLDDGAYDSSGTLPSPVDGSISVKTKKRKLLKKNGAEANDGRADTSRSVSPSRVGFYPGGATPTSSIADDHSDLGLASPGPFTSSASAAQGLATTTSALVSRIPSHDRTAPGAFIRSTRIAPVKLSMSQKVLAYLEELNIPPRPVMATGPVCAEFDRLQANILVALELKKQVDKADHDVRMATNRKAHLLGRSPPPQPHHHTGSAPPGSDDFP
ncbi:swr complex subunit [Tieghemiomyces parasiticus]|uniref:SWR1-complex protein 4 n=1 Tax=Tieghemiomyces parasiticus TaxID=78921 RepID=A0A9W7ZZB2_9FUNG|nr:swr complex subunit [Tieghemiomyces parasiticus]